ncbi:MAG: hypothetical protein J0L56_01065 [Chitinophagales bacterium]|nr:hypothetical protein [Chitinophagales bacterium]
MTFLRGFHFSIAAYNQADPVMAVAIKRQLATPVLRKKNISSLSDMGIHGTGNEEKYTQIRK